MSVLLYVLVFCTCIEGRTGFRRKITVAVNRRSRICLFQLLQQLDKGRFLSRCSCILRCLSVSRQTADVYHADTVCVLPYTVRPNLAFRPSCMDAAVTIYHVMIADALPSFFLVPSVDVCDRIIFAIRCGRAMHDNLVNLPHVFLFLLKSVLWVSVRASSDDALITLQVKL